MNIKIMIKQVDCGYEISRQSQITETILFCKAPIRKYPNSWEESKTSLTFESFNVPYIGSMQSLGIRTQQLWLGSLQCNCRGLW